MAIVKCLKDHAPTDAHQQTYVRPTYDLPCDVAGCRHPAVIWLNPEEVMDYERGSRVFWESNSFTTMKAGDSGPEQRQWDTLQVISHLFGRMSLARHLYLKLWRGTKPVSVSSPQDSDLPLSDRV